jgi:hypothetical protein
MDENPPNFDPPRALKGRRARRIWRELAQVCDEAGNFHAATRPVLASYCIVLAVIEENPQEADHFDFEKARKLGRMLGLCR